MDWSVQRSVWGKFKHSYSVYWLIISKSICDWLFATGYLLKRGLEIISPRLSNCHHQKSYRGLDDNYNYTEPNWIIFCKIVWTAAQPFVATIKVTRLTNCWLLSQETMAAILRKMTAGTFGNNFFSVELSLSSFWWQHKLKFIQYHIFFKMRVSLLIQKKLCFQEIVIFEAAVASFVWLK